MKARSTRWLRTLVLTLVPTSLVAAAFVLVPGTAAYAAVPSITTMGGPVNILPSAAKSAAGGYSSIEYLAAYIYKASKSPEFWDAYVKAQNTAASTGKPLALEPAVAAEAKTIYPAASKVAPLVKGAGAAGAAITAYQLSSTLTNGAMDLVGLDATGTVCSSVGKDLWGMVVAGAAGANCSALWDLAPDFKPNTDATGGFTMSPVCWQGQCITGFNGTFAAQMNSDTAYGGACFSATGLTRANPFQLIYKNPAGDTVWNGVEAGNTQTDTSGNPLCPGAGFGVIPTMYYGTYQAKARAWMDQVQVLCITNGAISCAPSPGTSPVEVGSADPPRTIKCVIAGSDGNTYQASSEEFRESAGALPGVKCEDLPPGVMADHTKIVETGGDKGDQTVWEADTDPAVRDALTKYGECGTTSVCPLVLSKDGESCFKGADCAGWYKQSDKTPYKCTYGKYPVALSECTIYANRWEPEAIRTGDNLSDPTTGKPLPNPKPELDPNSVAGVGASPADAELGKYNCWPSGWGAFNPANWVLQPIKCAFVPREGYPKVLQKSSTKGWDQTSPAKWSAAMAGWNLTTPADGCTGIPVSMHYGVLNIDANILAACKGDVLAPFAGWSRLFVAFSLSTVGVFALIRWGGALFGFEGLGRKEDD